MVHLKTVLRENATVAVGDLQEPPDFPGTVFGVERAAAGTMMPEIMHRYTRALGSHPRDHDTSQA